MIWKCCVELVFCRCDRAMMASIGVLTQGGSLTWCQGLKSGVRRNPRRFFLRLGIGDSRLSGRWVVSAAKWRRLHHPCRWQLKTDSCRGCAALRLGPHPVRHTLAGEKYHRGFREQVEKWPVHPLDMIIKWLRKYPKARVADFGCGEARLAATVSNKVYSFDLVSPNPRVTACDMANVPLKDSSVHVVVFCLSLMGTNLADFLREAYRVLLPGGLVKVAEVRSRFEGDEGGIDRFLEMTERLGFDTKQMDRSNKMFLLTEFKKSSRRPEADVEYQAKACVYKRR